MGEDQGLSIMWREILFFGLKTIVIAGTFNKVMACISKNFHILGLNVRNVQKIASFYFIFFRGKKMSCCFFCLIPYKTVIVKAIKYGRVKFFTVSFWHGTRKASFWLKTGVKSRCFSRPKKWVKMTPVVESFWLAIRVKMTPYTGSKWPGKRSHFDSLYGSKWLPIPDQKRR